MAGRKPKPIPDLPEDPSERDVSTRRNGKAVRSEGNVSLYPPRGSKKTWRVVVTRPENRVERTARTRTEAEELFTKLLRWDRQQLPIPKRRHDESTTEPTIADLAQRCLDFLRANGRSERYIDKIEDTLKNHVLPEIGKVHVIDWAPSDCTKVIAKARTSGKAAYTVQDIGSAMRALVSEAQRKPKWLPEGEDPMEGVSYAKKSRTHGQTATYVPPSQRPTTETVDRCATWLTERGERLGRPWLGLPGLIMGYAGLRLGEVLALSVEDIEGRIITVRATVSARNRAGAKAKLKDTKNSKSRSTIMPEDIAERVSKHIATAGIKTGLLFTDEEGNPIRTGNFSKLATLPARRAGVWPEGIPFENHRHHAATWWFNECGIELETISAMLGHHSVAFTMDNYFRTDEHSMRSALEKIDQAGRKAPEV